jgi:riboflavin-specific deaminase-like protein
MSTGLPLVTLKFAQTLDGKIATATGSSRWISSPASRRLAHRLRAANDAVLVGAGTVSADNPELTVRLVRGRNPLRVVLDSGLRLPPDAGIFRNQSTAATLVAVTEAAGKDKVAALRGMGVEVTTIGHDTRGKVDISQLLKTLARRNVSSVLVEGGAETITSFLRQKLADRLAVFIAPKLLGKGTDSIGELNITDIDRAVNLTVTRTSRIGGDFFIEADIKYD